MSALFQALGSDAHGGVTRRTSTGRAAGAPVVAVLGYPAAGKSFLSNHLAESLGLAYLDVNEQGHRAQGRWESLINRLDAEEGPCIVESCISPEPYRQRLWARGVVVIKVVADEAVRRERLNRRNLRASEIRTLLAMKPDLPRFADLKWHGALPMTEERKGAVTRAVSRRVFLKAPVCSPAVPACVEKNQSAETGFGGP